MKFIRRANCRHCLLGKALFILCLGPFLAPGPETEVFFMNLSQQASMSANAGQTRITGWKAVRQEGL